MVYMDAGMMEQVTRYHKVLTKHESIIRTALSVYVERMEENAKACREAYEAGKANPEVKAQQDASFMTNDGLRHLAAMSRESAASARKASDDILNAILGPEEDENNGQG
ncbi:hypothetical protein [Streptomyces sp. NPDC057854]|uniref:hypothetical protein n=1 Tax=unclassified Streptomyces TaxID=2593676 RepID=UPI0036CB20E6